MKNEAQKVAPLPTTVRVLGWVSFFTDVSSEMIFPLLPAFLTVVLGANPFVLGLIEGISDTTSSLLKLVSGYLSDRFKSRKFFVLLGYGLSSLLRPLTGLAPHWSMVLGVRFGDRVGKGLRTSPRDALIAQSVPASESGRAFGFQQMMDHAGAVLGSLIGAGLLFLYPGRYRAIFLLAGIPAFFALVTLARVREPEPAAKTKTAAQPGTKALPRNVKMFLALLFFFTLGNATDAFLLLRLQVNHLPLAAIPLLWAGLHVIKSLSNSWIGRLSDCGNRGFYLLLGWIFYAGVYAFFAMPLTNNAVIVLFLAYGVFYGLTEPTEKALLKEWVPAEDYGTAYGFYHTILGVALLPAGLIFGYLWKTWGYPAAFHFGAGITAVTALLWSLWFLKRPAKLLLTVLLIALLGGTSGFAEEHHLADHHRFHHDQYHVHAKRLVVPGQGMRRPKMPKKHSDTLFEKFERRQHCQNYPEECDSVFFQIELNRTIRQNINPSKHVSVEYCVGGCTRTNIMQWTLEWP